MNSTWATAIFRIKWKKWKRFDRKQLKELKWGKEVNFTIERLENFKNRVIKTINRCNTNT